MSFANKFLCFFYQDWNLEFINIGDIRVCLRCKYAERIIGLEPSVFGILDLDIELVGNDGSIAKLPDIPAIIFDRPLEGSNIHDRV